MILVLGQQDLNSEQGAQLWTIRMKTLSIRNELVRGKADALTKNEDVARGTEPSATDFSSDRY